MEVLRRTLSRKTRCEDRSSQLSRSFRKSLEPSPGRGPDVDDSIEACRKAAAWAWQHRAGGDEATRGSMETIAAAVVGNSKIDKPQSRFRSIAATSEADHNWTFKSESVSTNLFDTAELSSIIALFSDKLCGESSPDNSFAHRSTVDTLNERVCDFPTSDGLSQSCRFHQHKSDENAFPHRSFSSHSGSHHCHHTHGELKVKRSSGDSKSRKKEMGGSKPGSNQPNTFVASFRKPLPLIRRLFRKISKGNDRSHSAASEQVHHYHHHHHYYYHAHTPSNELQNLGEAKVRRHSDNFRVHRESELVDQDTRRIRKHSGSDCEASDCVGDGAAEVLHHQRHHDLSRDEILQPIPQHYLSNARPSRRYWNSFSA